MLQLKPQPQQSMVLPQKGYMQYKLNISHKNYEQDRKQAKGTKIDQHTFTI